MGDVCRKVGPVSPLVMQLAERAAVVVAVGLKWPTRGRAGRTRTGRNEVPMLPTMPHQIQALPVQNQAPLLLLMNISHRDPTH